jgi:Ser/Thr protein kinase RdoA (MazF antagonist)
VTEPLERGLPEEVARAFAIDGRFVSAERYGSGHINDTWAAAFERGGERVRYLVQRLNLHVFADPDALVANVARVTAHLRRKLADAGTGDVERRVLALVPARAGGLLHRDAAGGAWRAYVFIEGARSHDRAATPGLAREAARAFGSFQRLLLDYDGPRLHATLPGFHDTRRRLAALREVLARDAHGRAAQARAEIDFALAREALAGRLLDLHAAGKLPERVTHNDTKINNVLIDDATGEGVCVIDLDTVMLGLSLYDFGDLVRTAALTAAEDETDLARVEVDVALFAAVARGWSEALGDALLPLEREHLLAAGQLITFETGLRFLTDHLDGDLYFRIHRPGHNLDRCRTQFALLRSLEAREDELQEALDTPL